MEVDPGLLDRTYFLLNYAEMDPDCIKVFLLKYLGTNSFAIFLATHLA
jgi:hypothetical protein